MKKIFIFLFAIVGLSSFGQVIRPTPDWYIVTGGLHVGTLTATTAIITDATVTNLTATTATITTGAITNGTVTNLTATTATITTLALTGTATTKTLTTTGDISATGAITSVGAFYADSSGYFGDDKTNNWNRWFYQQVGSPASRLMLEHLGDISVQDKAGNGQVLAIQRDTTESTVKINIPNVKKVTAMMVKTTATDTAGVGSTANIGTIMYYNGHFYGLKAGVPPTWVALDN